MTNNTWQAYIQNITTGNDKGALFLIDGQCTKLAESDGSNITQEEVIQLVQIMQSRSKDNLPVLGGIEYWTIKVEPDELLATKRYNKQHGLSVRKTARMVVIGTYGEGHQPGTSQNAVCKVADYLIENGF
jgi:hypothetical protein